MKDRDRLEPTPVPASIGDDLITDGDLFLFNEGTHLRLWEKLGAHPAVRNDQAGTHFAVWAPNAREVSVIGDFNHWTPGEAPLRPVGSSGIWAGFVPGLGRGAHYKYAIVSHHAAHYGEKADPFGFLHEAPPRTASVVWDLAYEWHDATWLRTRQTKNAADAPISIYEVHLGSFMRHPEGRPHTYRELAPLLADHVKRAGFTHVELMPVMEHPFYGSWGYQVTGYFAPSSRFGTPQDLMYLIDYLHREDIGVILDWVPSHFPTDGHGLAYFDGTHLYEHADPRQGFHPDWKSYIFNFGRHEVQSFLLSSANFWLDVFHADGLRVDGVASILYLDYSRKEGEWVPNQYGGRENLEAIHFLRKLNEAAYGQHPEVQTWAEESTAYPMVSRPTYVGGLGFGFKWDMGWMHDTLQYMSHDPVHRKFHHDKLTFRMIYAFNESFVLPLSHDEVVHGKGSLLDKMPGDRWQQRANLRLLLGMMFAQPGKKLLFMGGEFGADREWNHDSELPWHLLASPAHEGILRWVSDLNHVYRSEPALHERDVEAGGFRWNDLTDVDQSVLSFQRHGREGTAGEPPIILVAFNFTPVPRFGYRLGAPRGGRWLELLNGDAQEYGGSGLGNLGGLEAEPVPTHGQPFSLVMTLPPLSAVFLKSP